MAKMKPAAKAGAKRKLTANKVAPKPRKTPPTAVTVKRSGNAVTISYDRPEDALPHILDLASDFADKHFAMAAFTAAEDDVLGTAAAREIVSGCANSDCWSCTLADLKLDSNVFQSCVFEGVKNKGYTIGRDEIPASQSTQLYTVVMAIQGAKRRAEG
jgi:hypothetical protein